MNDIFEQLDVLKGRIQDEVLLNQNLLKLIRYTDESPLTQPDIDNVQELINTYIYFKPLAYDKIIQETRTFFILEFNMSPTSQTNNYVDINFDIKIIMHNSLMDITVDNESKTRAFAIGSELNKSFCNEKGSWIGNCTFKRFDEIRTSQDYYGIAIRYQVTDFKR